MPCEGWARVEDALVGRVVVENESLGLMVSREGAGAVNSTS